MNHKISMYKSFFFISCLVTCHLSLSNNNFKLNWIDKSNHLHQEIDLTNGAYRIEVKPGVWKNQAKLKLQNIDLSLFPDEFDYQYHEKTNLILFNIPGTGLVFTFDKKLYTLTRTDKTFYRGFNFKSFSFISNDTLFSIGGEGFWSTNSTLIFFDSQHLEWEKKSTKNLGPIAIEWDFGGYSTNKNLFYCLEGKSEYLNNDFKEKSFYVLDLNNLTWKELGKINTLPFSNQIQVNQFKYWLGDFFIYLDGFDTNVYILDPVNNKILLYKGNNSQLKKGSNEIFRHGDFIYISGKNKNGEYLDSVSVKSLMDHSIEIGKMYKSTLIPKSSSLTIILIFLITLLTLLMIVVIICVSVPN